MVWKISEARGAPYINWPITSICLSMRSEFIYRLSVFVSKALNCPVYLARPV
jgi:hypothetical protein